MGFRQVGAGGEFGYSIPIGQHKPDSKMYHPIVGVHIFTREPKHLGREATNPLVFQNSMMILLTFLDFINIFYIFAPLNFYNFLSFSKHFVFLTDYFHEKKIIK